jgi:hypothetical protein
MDNYYLHLKIRRQKQDMVLVFKMIKGGQGENIFQVQKKPKWRQDQAGSNSAWTNNTVQHARTDIRKNLFAVRDAELWIQLPDSIKQAESKEGFETTEAIFTAHTSPVWRLIDDNCSGEKWKC